MVSKIFNKNRSNILLLIALLVYNNLFYFEWLGVNLLVFTLLLLSFQYVLFKDSFRSRNVLVCAGLTVFMAIMVVWHNSVLSKFMYFISYIITLGFILQPTLSFIGSSWLSAMINYLKIPLELLSWNKSREENASGGFRISKLFMLAGFPVIIALIFFLIYRTANPKFAEFTDLFLNRIEHWITYIFKHFSFIRLIFLGFGFVLLSGVLMHRHYNFFAKEEERLTDTIVRKKSEGRWPFLRLDLRHEYLSGIILLVMMNILLLVLNIIDIKYIWISFEIPQGVSLSEMVHDGTEWLIVSIVLSMIVVIYMFRGNQNFYSKSHILKYLALAWMLQNMVLTVSLLMRNNMYVSWHALAYKRLGVYVFIALTFIGLVTMLIKIFKAKSFFYLLKVNSWAALFIMCGTCCVNWDIFIAKYNVEFSKGSQLDTNFLLELSPKSYPYILDSMEKVAAAIKAHENVTSVIQRDAFEEELRRKSLSYIARHSTDTWCSFNYADQYALNYLKNKYQ